MYEAWARLGLGSIPGARQSGFHGRRETEIGVETRNHRPGEREREGWKYVVIPRNPRIPWVWTPLLGEEEGGQPSGDLEVWKGTLSPWQLNGFGQSKQASSRDMRLARELKMLVVPCTAAECRQAAVINAMFSCTGPAMPPPASLGAAAAATAFASNYKCPLQRSTADRRHT